MRHLAACIGILGLTALGIHTVTLNIESRQRGYRVAENISEADGLRQVIASRRAECRRLLEMEDVQGYIRQLGLTVDALLPPVIPEESYEDVLAYGGSRRSRPSPGRD